MRQATSSQRQWGVIAVLAAAITVAGATQIFAVEPVNTTFFGNLAVKGYDVVAYFTDGTAVKGAKEHTIEWNGASWRFASAEHLRRFTADPERYAPQYGGYCAWAVSQGSTADIDPDAWRIVDDKLYLNYNEEIQHQWEQDREQLITAADANWPTLVDKKGE